MSLADLVTSETGLQSSIDAADDQRDAWFEQRRGKFTCSRFGDLMKSGRAKNEDFSQVGWTYIYQVAAERLGSFKHSFESASTRWGNDHEAEAIEAYCGRGLAMPGNVTSGVNTFCDLAPHIGGTPDGLVGEDGCLEIKCPYTPEEHMRYVHQGTVPDKYLWQVIGHLLVSGRSWCHFASYDPRLMGPKRLFVTKVDRASVETNLKVLRDKLDLANRMVQEVIGGNPDEVGIV